MKKKKNRKRRLPCSHLGCKKTFTEKKNLKIHIKRVHEGMQFQCIQCRKMLASKFSLKRHNLDVHKIENSEADDEIVYKEVIDGTMMTEYQQDEIINEQNLTIESLKAKLKNAKDELKTLRAQVLSMQTPK